MLLVRELEEGDNIQGTRGMPDSKRLAGKFAADFVQEPRRNY